VEIGGKEVVIAALCKGSGMIAPSLATMIAVVTTDCAISPPALQAALGAAMKKSFNALTVDGDMSTNDVVFALANGLAGNAPLSDPGPDLDRFTAALAAVCEELAKEIAADGEGATKVVEVHVSGAPSDEVALDCARAVAGSSLVKAAIFGADPNWGRVLASIGARAGTAGYPIEPAQAKVSVQSMEVYDRAPVAHDTSVLKARMREPEVRVAVDLRAGNGSGVAWGCDLTYDYVKINADYTSLIVPRPDGGVAKDDRLANYSPTFKQQLLVEALGYIRRFAGTRCVVKYGGAAMMKESLKKSFCDDIGLLRSVGLHPRWCTAADPRSPAPWKSSAASPSSWTASASPTPAISRSSRWCSPAPSTPTSLPCSIKRAVRRWAFPVRTAPCFAPASCKARGATSARSAR